jgi:hypothetical protein
MDLAAQESSTLYNLFHISLMEQDFLKRIKEEFKDRNMDLDKITSCWFDSGTFYIELEDGSTLAFDRIEG